MPLNFEAISTDYAHHLQNGGLDAYKNTPERILSDGNGNPCRHCLNEIPKDIPMLLLAYQPFPIRQPYAETGPIFLCITSCKRHSDSTHLPKLFADWDQLLIRGYDINHHIVSGTGRVIHPSTVETDLQQGFQNPDVTYFHIRSATNNCYLAKVTQT